MLDIVQEASRECVALAGHSTVAVKVVVRSPAIGADLTDYVTALFENFPELRRGVGSRKPTCHAYDRDMVPGSQITVPPPSVTCWMLADRQDSGRFPDRCRYGREAQSRSRPRMAPGHGSSRPLARRAMSHARLPCLRTLALRLGTGVQRRVELIALEARVRLGRNARLDHLQRIRRQARPDPREIYFGRGPGLPRLFGGCAPQTFRSASRTGCSQPPPKGKRIAYGTRFFCGFFCSFVVTGRLPAPAPPGTGGGFRPRCRVFRRVL